MLMVGTLQCRRRHPAATDGFNAFVRNQDEALVANNEVLKGRFMRESGVEYWQADLDRFSTSLANLYSGRLDNGGYCRMMVRTAWDAADANGEQLFRMSQAFSDAPVSGACQVGGHAERGGAPKVAISDALHRSPSPIPPVAVVVAPEAPVAVLAEVEPAPAPDLEPLAAVAEAEAVSAEAVAEAAAPEPEPVAEAEVALASAAPAEAAQPSRDEALRAAVVALQSAVVALQAVSAPPGAQPR